MQKIAICGFFVPSLRSFLVIVRADAYPRSALITGSDAPKLRLRPVRPRVCFLVTVTVLHVFADQTVDFDNMQVNRQVVTYEG